MSNKAIDLEPIWSPVRRFPGRLVVFCGFDGSGKTTQLSKLQARLEGLGNEVFVTRQPSDRYRNDPLVRSFLAKGGSKDAAYELARLSAADRMRHFSESIAPVLSRGGIVLCDRYVFSTFAYFLYRGVDLGTLIELNDRIYKPDLALYLDLDASGIRARLMQRDGLLKMKREEMSEVTIHEILSNFRAMTPPLIPVAANATPDFIHSEVVRLFDKAL